MHHNLIRIVLVGFALGAGTLTVAEAQTVSADLRVEGRVIMNACRTDASAFCSDVTPGGGRIFQCLKAHAPQLSQPCAQMMPRAEILIEKARQANALPK